MKSAAAARSARAAENNGRDAISGSLGSRNSNSHSSSVNPSRRSKQPSHKENALPAATAGGAVAVAVAVANGRRSRRDSSSNDSNRSPRLNPRHKPKLENRVPQAKESESVSAVAVAAAVAAAPPPRHPPPLKLVFGGHTWKINLTDVSLG